MIFYYIVLTIQPRCYIVLKNDLISNFCSYYSTKYKYWKITIQLLIGLEITLFSKFVPFKCIALKNNLAIICWVFLSCTHINFFEIGTDSLRHLNFIALLHKLHSYTNCHLPNEGGRHVPNPSTKGGMSYKVHF